MAVLCALIGRLLARCSVTLEKLSASETKLDLGPGPAFGSRKSMVVELSISHLAHIPDAEQRDVLAFDWWIHNADRILTESGGNPNLFWDVEREALTVIDHNQAFDPKFPARDLLDLHVFSGQQDALFGDWVVCQGYNARFAKTMAKWPDICNTVPPAWWYVDPEETIRTEFDLLAIHAHLMKFLDDSFWKRP